MHIDFFLYNLYGAVISFLTITQTSGSIKSGPCKHGAKRNETDLRKKLESSRAEDEYSSYFFLLSELSPSEEKARFLGRTDRTYIFGQRRCHQRLTKKQLSKGLMYRSTCPWYVELTVNHDRYPTYMATAKCSCKHCYNGNGTKYSDETKAPMCREVKRRVTVLRQEFMNLSDEWVPQCTNGVKDYYKHYEDVAIGCTCALQPSDENGNPAADK